MKQNCERLDRIASSTTKVKMLAACSKAFIMREAEDDDFNENIPENVETDNEEEE